MATDMEQRILERVEAMFAEIRKDMVTKGDFSYGLSTLRKDIESGITSLREHLEGKIADVSADVQWIREQYPV